MSAFNTGPLGGAPLASLPLAGDSLQVYAQTATGGAQTAGTAVQQATYSITSTSGDSCSGSATVQVVYSTTTSSGVTCGGNAILYTTFFLHDATNTVSGTLPSGEQSTDTADVTWSGANTVRQLGTTIGSLQIVASQGSLATTSPQKHFIRMFATLPLLKNQSVGTGPITINIANENFSVDGINIYVWRPSSGTKVGTLYDNTDTNL